MAVVELEGIGPAGEVGVPAVGQDERAATGLHLPVIVGLPFQVGFAPLDVELGVLLHPGMIRGGVVGDEVHEELKPPGSQALFQAEEVRLPAEIPVQGVARDRKGRAADVGLGKIRQRCLKLLQPLRVTQGHLASGRAGLPEAQEPDVIEALGSHLVEKGIGDIGQGSRTPQRVGQLPEPHPGVYLVQGRIKRHLNILLKSV